MNFLVWEKVGAKGVFRCFSKLYKSLKWETLTCKPAENSLASTLYRTAEGLTVSEFRPAEKMSYCYFKWKF